MKRYDVELITDKNGKPMPQYYDVKANEMRPITSDNASSIEIDNFPAEQDVTLTNDTIDVNVTNQTDSVDVNNLPSDYPDQAVKQELESIKQTQADILERLNAYERYAKTDNDMPSADSVPVGAFCMVVDTGKIYQSNGADWKVFA